MPWWATTSAGSPTPSYLPAAAAAGATVVATHIRLGPRIPDPDPVYDDVVETVAAFLIERGSWARDAGLTPDRIVVDAGLDLGKTAEQSLTLLRASDRLAGLGYPLLLSASNKTFLGMVLGLEIDERSAASLAATALGAALGCRIMRVHDVAAHRQVCSVMAAIRAASDSAASDSAVAAPPPTAPPRAPAPARRPWLRWAGSADRAMSAATVAGTTDGRCLRTRPTGPSIW